jgi:cation transport regulator ChaC
VSDDQRAVVLDHLDHRERGGFDRIEVEVRFESPHPASRAVSAAHPVAAVTYVAPPTNPNYLGPAPLSAIAEQVRRSHGPSGSNLEYVVRLAESLTGLGVEDDPVFELVAKL